jgi:HAMP domain-containing protein
MAQGQARTGRWIVIAALLALAALVAWIALRNDVPSDAYHP